MLTDMTELFKCVHFGYAYLDPEVVNRIKNNVNYVHKTVFFSQNKCGAKLFNKNINSL